MDSIGQKHCYVRTVSVFNPVLERQLEVSREISPDGFDLQPAVVPQDGVVSVGLYTSQPADKERAYGFREAVDAQGEPIEPDSFRQQGLPKDALFLASQQTVQYSGHNPAVLFCEQLQDGPDAYSVQVLDPVHERARYIRSDGQNYQGDAVRAIAQEVAEKTPEFVKQWDQLAAKTRLPFLQNRYGERQNMAVLEVGPGTTGGVARTFLKEGNGNLYTGIDLSPDALRMQKEVLASDGIEVNRMTQLVGNASQQIPVPDASQDLVVGYSSISTWGSTEEVKSTFDELARILKPGGELLAAGTGLDSASPPAIAYILSKFELIPQRETDRSVDYILRRR